MTAVDAVLLKGSGPLDCDPSISGALAQLAARQGLALASLDVHVAQAGGECYAYLEMRRPLELDACAMAEMERMARDIVPLAGWNLRAARLARQFELWGASHGQPAPYHYVVETDAAEGWMEEIVRWYDREHMPGLAAVAGCVRVRRYFNLDSGPRSLACYDLVTPEILASAPWLAVRHTGWSDRVRPNFRNTRRTMFRTLPQRDV